MTEQQRIKVERNQIWQHKKGTTYKIYGVATRYRKYDCVLYYQMYNSNDEFTGVPHYVVDTETLCSMLLFISDIDFPLDTLYVEDGKFNEQLSQTEISNLKSSQQHFLWARELNNFLDVGRFKLQR